MVSPDSPGMYLKCCDRNTRKTVPEMVSPDSPGMIGVIDNQPVWVEDPTHGFVLGKIVDLGSKEARVQLIGCSKLSNCPYDRIFPAEDGDKDVEDNSDKAFRDMKVLSQSQSMIVSGESGAGKTESTKYILRYLCETGGYAAGPIEQRILDGLAFRTMQTACGDVINVPLKPREAASARDALAKSMYSRLFDNIVSRINASIPFQTSAFYIGVLDIAGFELVEDKMGVIDLLNEEGKLPKPDACHFTAAVHKNLHGHFRLELPRCSKLRQHRELRDDEGFIIRHFAGAVCYETAQFIEKNNDALHSSLEALVCEAKNHFLKSLFETVDQPKRSGKLNYVSVASKFRGQLNELMEKLQSTGTSFIRCIKPNGKMAPKDFDGGGILSQLQCAGMGSVLKLMQQGYPSRTGFQSLHEMYKQYLPGKLARLDARLFCKALFKALGLNDTDFKFGVSKVFFRAGKFAEFDQMLKSDPENLAALVDRVKQWLLRSRWKKVQWGAIMKSTKINLDHMQRIASELKANRENSLSIVANLDRNLMAAITKIKTDDKILRSTIEADYVEIVTRVNKELILLDKKLEQQKTAEEQEKLRRIQEQMEADRKREEEEKLRVAEEATMKRKKSQIEVQRRLEEEEARQLEALAVKAEAERETIAARHRLNTTQFASMSVEERYRFRYLLLSNRSVVNLVLAALALERNSNRSLYPQDEEVAANQWGSGAASPVKTDPTKYDLTKWKYSDLRDAINTSCDVDLLEACREEFHRRLKVYHSWKAKNKKRIEAMGHQRAPQSVLDSAMRAAGASGSSGTVSRGTGKQRYFRIPFVRPVGDEARAELAAVTGGRKGWWYAHFDGPYVARQMELHDHRSPVLLLAGKDDVHMCELTLEETGLTRKKGAEILEEEFEKEWRNHGGLPYTRPSVLLLVAAVGFRVKKASPAGSHSDRLPNHVCGGSWHSASSLLDLVERISSYEEPQHQTRATRPHVGGATVDAWGEGNTPAEGGLTRQTAMNPWHTGGAMRKPPPTFLAQSRRPAVPPRCRRVTRLRTGVAQMCLICGRRNFLPE
ncbi:unnamed protein product [Notodromas monacha]|uniref:Unconventional myosin-VI n=1 Tax=Notodromas monacha TaxID=399045 RepID=A0A7R9GH65_9CRUS|nr:unnamed protein product [Notodromas monacha]CAG0921150.1 unnamed protein product [Notodromas monacha]